MNFEFVQPKNKKIETDELIKDLVAVAERLGKSPTIAEYNENGKFEASVFFSRFGSWNAALQNVNLPINNRAWSEIELFSNIEKVWIYLGKQPTRRIWTKSTQKYHLALICGAFILGLMHYNPL